MVEDTLAKLDGIIRRTFVGRSHGRCGTTGRFLVSAGVPTIVRGITARYRSRMPPPVWAAVCSQFVDFVVSKQPPEGPRLPCPLSAAFEYPDDSPQHGKEPAAPGAPTADGSLACQPDGPPNRCLSGQCPKCGVVAVLVRALRDMITEEVRICCVLCCAVPFLCGVRRGGAQSGTSSSSSVAVMPSFPCCACCGAPRLLESVWDMAESGCWFQERRWGLAMRRACVVSAAGKFAVQRRL